MTDYLIIAALVLLIIIIILLIVLRPKKDNSAALLEQKLDINSKNTDSKITELSEKMQGLTKSNYEQQIKLMETLNKNALQQTEQVGKAITAMQESNEKKLEEMRKTVDEKLTDTLNKRINASFETVSKQLENVYKSLGDMQRLSGDVTKSVQGLNSVLTNVKSRGTWAEVQLGNILDQIIPGMYETNVRTYPKCEGQVEFAVKIPNSDDDSITWLPIDSKFPMEDYIRITNAAENGDSALLESARKSLETRIKAEAKAITKYISVPETTPFAIMYLATEGLYAEVMQNKNGLAENLQSQGIMVAGPSTITALLNSLSMGFKSIAINKKASEVYDVLGAAKAQYDKFGDLLETARRRIESAGNAISDAENKNNFIQRKLKTVESLDIENSNEILGIE
ncbi:MAG: DNA recombination protein RmuC [Eubacterium sp.]|nr:DNA recombination protein RmuC [Eubacterium sp.]